MIDFFFNYLAMPAIFGVLLFWIASWIWVFAKADQAIHNVLDPKPRMLTPEEQAAINARVKANTAKIMAAWEAQKANAHHH